MPASLDVIIVDDDPAICEVVSMIIKRFYTWGQVLPFTNAEEAIAYCQKSNDAVAIFILDVYLGRETGFSFLEAIINKFPMAFQDTIIITGNASDEVVNMCIASEITFLIEKPIRSYTLQLAVQAIVAKYIKFAKKLLGDPVLAESVASF